MLIKDILDIKDLLQRFPGGFAVTPSGKVLEIVTNFQDPIQAQSIKPPRDDSNAWGFLVVAVPMIQTGDSEKFEKRRISVQDFYKVYESQVFYEEEQLHQVVEKLNNIGVGIDHEWEVGYKPREQGGYSLILLRKDELANMGSNGANASKFSNT